MPKDSKKRAAILNSMEVNWVAFYAKDVGKFWPVYILSYVLAIFLSLVSIVLLQKFTRTMVWLFLLGISVELSIDGYLFYKKYMEDDS